MRKSALTLRNEEKLLVLIADEAMRPEAHEGRSCVEAAALLAEPFDWPLFMRLAACHNHAAAACAALKNFALLEKTPSNVRAALEKEHVLSQARFLKKEHELLAIVNGLESAGIFPIVIKGIPLAYLLYRNPGVRVSKDIDILVPKPDVQAAENVLLEIGYSLYEGVHTAADYSAYHFHHVFCLGARQDSVIELHWDLLSPMMTHYTFNAAALRERAIPVRIGNASVLTPELPHAFWHMGIHASYRSFLAFRSLVEMKGMSRRFAPAQWEEVFSWSTRCNTDREIAMAINLCESLCGDILDASLRSKARLGRSAKLFILSTFYPRALMWEWLPFAATHELVIALYMKRGFAAKMKYLIRLVVPDRAARFGLYFKYRGDGVFDRMCLHLNGFYVLLKTAFLTIFMGFLIRSGIIGERRLDPARNAGRETSEDAAARVPVSPR